MNKKIRVGAEVLLIAGKERGRIAKVKLVRYPYLYLDQCNIKKRSIKDKGFASIESKIHVSNVQLKPNKND